MIFIRQEMLEIPKEKSPHLALQEKQSATGPSQSAPPHITRLLGRGFKGVDKKGVIYSQFYPPHLVSPCQARLAPNMLRG